ncbi:MAG: Asp-tRNA(Asn)/Glu-tRNA(Gln) amidotransferase subunit GatC [Alphaproteobacteria bacterium]
MTIDIATVTRIANLARIKMPEEDKPQLSGQLNSIFDFVKQLDEVDVAGITPMAGCQDMGLRLRADAVHDGGQPENILANAPERAADFFVVPKVVE